MAYWQRCLVYWHMNIINTLRPTQYGCHFADTIFTFILFCQNWCIFPPRPQLKISLSALVQVKTWHRTSDKPLSETLVASLLTHIHIHFYLFIYIFIYLFFSSRRRAGINRMMWTRMNWRANHCMVYGWDESTALYQTGNFLPHRIYLFYKHSIKWMLDNISTNALITTCYK